MKNDLLLQQHSGNHHVQKIIMRSKAATKYIIIPQTSTSLVGIVIIKVSDNNIHKNYSDNNSWLKTQNI